MRRVKVKICGLKREEDLMLACELGVDIVGFVVGVPSSPRNLNIEEAARLMRGIPEGVRSAIVTVPQSLKQLSEAYYKLKPDLIQVHGPLDLGKLRKELPEAIIIRALSVSSVDTLKEALSSLELVNGFLADSFHSGKYGGTGITHNWYLSKRLKGAVYPKPLILAGGLNPNNVEEAVRYVKPYAVDVSSGVESTPGSKDPEKLRTFIRRAKGVQLEGDYPDLW
ncbi:MAG: phosphoribosylanthranilate isomerase [Candidatus Korarchaeum sp.]|nr:phosphoribosylanthranilate isomerase [Candidatus Korarchaeum sp.]